MKRQKGITFIELLVLIAIVGILVSIAGGGIARYKAEHARDSAPAVIFVPK